MRLALSETQKTLRFSRGVASYISLACSTALGQILQVQQIIIFKKMMRKLLIRYVNGSHIILLCSTSSNTQVIRTAPERETARTLIFWLQVSGMTLY